MSGRGYRPTNPSSSKPTPKPAKPQASEQAKPGQFKPKPKPIILSKPPVAPTSTTTNKQSAWAAPKKAELPKANVSPVKQISLESLSKLITGLQDQLIEEREARKASIKEITQKMGPTVPPGYVTCAQMYQNLHSDNLFIYSTQYPHSIADNLSLPDNKFPKLNEEVTIKWGERKIQAYWTQQVLPWLKKKTLNSPTELFDTHDKRTIGSLMPDGVSSLKGQPINEFHIQMVMDLKKKSKTNKEFTNEDKGKLYNYMLQILKLQTYRQFLWGFLCDACHIQFFHLSRRFVLTEYPREYLCVRNKHGQRILLHLLTADLHALGNAPEIFSFTAGEQSVEFEVVNALGEGRSSNVFLTKMDTQQYVAKVFKADSINELQLEQNILGKAEVVALQNRVGGCVPRIHYSNASTLILTPVGIHFATTPPFEDRPRFTRACLCLTVELLRDLHACHIVHRDVTFNNLFQDTRETGAPSILLNDFGCAVTAGVDTEFKGAISLASVSVLEQCMRAFTPVRHTPHPCDDLEMLVHTIYATFVDPVEYARLARDQQVNNIIPWLASLKQFWETSLNIAGWRESVAAARNLEYTTLIQKLIVEIDAFSCVIFFAASCHQHHVMAEGRSLTIALRSG